VLDGLVRLGVAGAGELAQELGITPAAVRQHLRTLLERGFAEVTWVRTGRPGPHERVWRATPKGQGRVRPQRFALLLGAFLRAAKARLGAEGLVGLLEGVARYLAREIKLEKGVPFTQKVAHLQQFLGELAVATRLRKEGDEYELGIVNPILPDDFSHFPEAYTFYRTLAEEVLGVEVELILQLDSRQGPCVLRFRAPEGEAGRGQL